MCAMMQSLNTEKNGSLSTAHASSVCAVMLFTKFMNSRKYTHNQSESMNQNDQCTHMFSQSVCETPCT